MEERQRFAAEFEREAIRSMRTSAKPAAVMRRGSGVPRSRLYKRAQEAVQNRLKPGFERSSSSQLRNVATAEVRRVDSFGCVDDDL